MKKQQSASPREPERWIDRARGELGSSPEDRLGALMRNGAPSKGLTPGEQARVWARLGEGGHRASFRAFAGLRWSVAGAVLLLASAGVVAGATTHRWWPVVTGSSRSAAPSERGTHNRGAAGVVPARRELAVTMPANAAPRDVAPPVPSPPVAASRRTADLPKVRSPRAGAASDSPTSGDAAPAATPEPAAAPSGLSLETSLLSEALTRLRQRRDARGALETLDAYDAQFPRGALRHEADGTRVDALLLLGHDDEALFVLRRLTLEPRGRDQELRVIRAELLAAATCHEAVTDFDHVLSEAAPPALAERALHGRASCLAQLGDPAGAARDLREYLRRFPDGRFAADARRLLDESSL